MTTDRILACDVGGTRMRVALVGLDGSVGDKEVISTPGDDPDALVRIMSSVLSKAVGRTAGVVVGVPGLVDYSRGQVLKLPNLPAWDGHVSAPHLSKALGLTVLLANDADLAALGEHRFGAGRGSQDMVYMTSSTGVGGGVILNGRLLHGKLSLAEIGHTLIDKSKDGTLESLGSGTALGRLAGESAALVSERAAAGDEKAREQFDQVARDFAIGVHNVVHCFSPEVVVIGGGMSKSGDMLLDPVRKMLEQTGPFRSALNVRVVRASGDDDVGLKGAAAFWADYQKK